MSSQPTQKTHASVLIDSANALGPAPTLDTTTTRALSNVLRTRHRRPVVEPTNELAQAKPRLNVQRANGTSLDVNTVSFPSVTDDAIDIINTPLPTFGK